MASKTKEHRGKGGPASGGGNQLPSSVSRPENDSIDRPLMFDVNMRGKYRDWKHTNIAYQHIVERYYKGSSASKKWQQVLGPMKGDIDRIVTIGLGCPSNGSIEIFIQTAMIDHAMRLLGLREKEYPTSWQSDYSSNEESEEFLYKAVRIDTIEYPHKKADEDRRPEKFTVHLDGATTQERNWMEKSHVLYLKEKITSKTLLFMPNLPYSPALRIIAATRPAMIITNQVHAWWKNVKLRNTPELFPEADAEPYKAQWAAEFKAWEHLRDHYKRKELTLETPLSGGFNHWMVYLPLQKGEKLDSEWIARHQGINYDIEAAKDSLYYSMTGTERPRSK